MADYVVTIVEAATASDVPGGVVFFHVSLYNSLSASDQYTIGLITSDLAESVTTSDVYSISPRAYNLTIVEGLRTSG